MIVVVTRVGIARLGEMAIVGSISVHDEACDGGVIVHVPGEAEPGMLDASLTIPASIAGDGVIWGEVCV